MDSGFILLSRKLLDSDVFASQKLLKIWIWCLLKANFKDRAIPLKIGKGESIIKVNKGSFLFGRYKAEEELFIDGSTIYKAIKKLEGMDMISIKSNNQYSVISICNYDVYQSFDTYKVTSKEQPSNSQVTSEEQPSNTTNTFNTLKEVKEIILYLNNSIGKNFKSSTNKTQLLIKARFSDGFNINDFKKVIDIKSKQWLNTDMGKYLRPETLFGTKFEGYLNESHNPNEIDLSRVKGNQGKTLCPECKELGKTHWKDDCLSVNKEKQIFNCHKCGFSGYYGEVVKTEIEYKKPNIGNLTELKDIHLQAFSKRGITQKTIIRNGIKSSKDWYCFQYLEGSEVVNIKYRKHNEKKFMQAPEAKPTMYKYNDIVNQEKIIICEGEYDALSWEEAGFNFATSVNQGAPNVNDKNIEKKLECIYNCFDIFEKAELIYLSVDNDDNGQRLQRELIKIFTAEKIKLIDHGQRKDANEVLCLDGKNKLIELFENAKDVKVDGVFEANDFKSEILESYKNGQSRGTTTYFTNIDKCWTHRRGEVTLWTGYMNEGKSLLLRFLLLIKGIYDDWKSGFFAPEDMPQSEFYTDIIESFIGKSADPYQEQYNNYMSEAELLEGLDVINRHFYSVFPEENHDIDSLLNKFSYLVRKKNLSAIVFDPYNMIMHLMKSGEREDLYISRFMSKLKRFAIKHNVAVHLVAHQVTPAFKAGENYPQPNAYKIKGGGTFADKADNVVIVWREHRNTDQSNTEVKFISQKIKKQKLTGIPGEAIIDFDRRKNRYSYFDKCPLDGDSQININQGIEPGNGQLEFEETNEMPF